MRRSSFALIGLVALGALAPGVGSVSAHARSQPATSQSTQTVVENNPPTVRFTPLVYASDPLRVYADANASSDCDSEPLYDLYWSWGDGTESDGFWEFSGAGECSPTAANVWQHAYASPGRRSIHLLMHDTSGQEGRASHVVRVARMAPDTEETNAAITYKGTWAVGPCGSSRCSADRKQKYTSTVGSKATLTFTGTSADWVGSMGPHAGTARVSVDGVSQGRVSLVNPPAYGVQDGLLLFAGTKLASGRHTITIARISGRINIDAFRIHK